MNKFFILLTFLLSSVTLFSQDYTPFPDSNATWKSSEKPYPPPPIIWYTYHWDYVIMGDSVINDFTYKKIGRIDYDVQCSQIYNGPYFVTLIRDDTFARKVYHWDDLYGETLMWDFTLQVGDSVPNGFNGGYGYVVASIDSVLCGGSYRKRFHYEGDGIYPLEVIEGIGANTGLLEEMLVFEHIHWLRCFYQDGEPIYLNPEVVQCDLEIDTCSTVGISEIHSNQMVVSVIPNPISGSANLSYALDKPSTVTIYIFHPMGQLIEKIEQEQLKGEQKLEWNAEELPAGMYYFRIHTGDRIGGGKMVVVRP